MLDALGIDFGGCGVHAQREQQVDDNPMAFTSMRSHLLPALGQKDCTIRLRCDEAVSLQALYGVVDGRARNAEPLGEIDDPCFADLLNEVSNEFHVVLGKLRLVRLANSFEALSFGTVVAIRQAHSPKAAGPEATSDTAHCP